MAVKDILTPLVFKEALKTKNLITIAKEYGVSKQYITQLYSEYKVHYPELFAEPEITAQWLTAQLENHTILEICNMTGKSYHHIHNLMKQYGLQKPTSTAAFDEELIRKAYVDECKSDRSIALQYGCSVKKFRYEQYIFKTDRKALCERLTKDIASKLIQSDYSVAQISEQFDATEKEVIKVLFSYGIEV